MYVPAGWSCLFQQSLRLHILVISWFRPDAPIAEHMEVLMLIEGRLSWVQPVLKEKLRVT